MNDPRGRTILFLLAAILAGGCDRQPYSVTGRVMNARNGVPIAGATIAARSRDTLATQAGTGGYYVLAGILRRDTIDVSAGGYLRSTFIVRFELKDPHGRKQDVYLEPDVDTAYTAAGPVDASIFFDNSGLKRKKLSLNEARLVLSEEFPGARIRKGALVNVSDAEEWLFEMKIGRASASVYVDAYTGKIKSIESDDPTFDRTLQSHIDR
jgi:hypothetical protein